MYPIGMNYSEIRKYLLEAPDSQLDSRMKPYIEKWGNVPKAAQVLEVLDYIVNGSLASGFVVKLMEILLSVAIDQEGTTYEAVVAQATWRTKLQ